MQLSEHDRTFLRDLLRKESANVLGPSSGGQWYTRLAVVAQREGAAGVRELMTSLRSGRWPHLRRAVAEAMTIKETSFFRDLAPFALLRDRLIPELIERRRSEQRLRIWSGACSTGQEAYSLAILLCENFSQLKTWDVGILGTDISQAACEYAARGRYKQVEIDRGMPVPYLLRYFEQDGNEWKVKAALRRLVRFERTDLCSPSTVTPTFDLVLLRNVLLYLAPEDRARVLRGVHARMQPHAPLLLGNAEQTEDSCDLFCVEFHKETYFYRLLSAY